MPLVPIVLNVDLMRTAACQLSLALLAAVLSACTLSFDYSGVEFACSDGETCPSGYSCELQVCRLIADPLSDGGGPLPGEDARVADAGSGVPDAGTNAPDAGTPPADAMPADAMPPDAAVATCDELFSAAPAYKLCSEEVDRCSFNVTTGGGTCDDACAALGSTCLGALNNGADPCISVGTDTCQTPRQTEICICAKP